MLDRGEYKARAFKIVLPDGPYVILQTGYGEEPWDTVVKRLRENEPPWDYNASTFTEEDGGDDDS